MGKSKWFCPTAKPRPDHILKKYFKIFLKLTAMVGTQATGFLLQLIQNPEHLFLNCLTRSIKIIHHN